MIQKKQFHCNRVFFFYLSSMNVQGDTALHFASKWGYSGIVELLLENGADPQTRNRRGQTPMTLAHSNHIARLLQEIKPTLKKNGRSTLHCNGAIHKETGTKKRTLKQTPKRHG